MRVSVDMDQANRVIITLDRDVLPDHIRFSESVVVADAKGPAVAKLVPVDKAAPRPRRPPPLRKKVQTDDRCSPGKIRDCLKAHGQLSVWLICMKLGFRNISRQVVKALAAMVDAGDLDKLDEGRTGAEYRLAVIEDT